MKYQLWVGESRTEFNIGLEGTAGGLIGGNLAFLEFKCAGTIMEYKLNARGPLYLPNQFLLKLVLHNN